MWDLSGVEGAVIKSIMVDPWPVGSWAARMESSPNAAESFLFPSLFIFPPPPSFLSPPSKAWRSCLPFQHSLHHSKSDCLSQFYLIRFYELTCVPWHKLPDMSEAWQRLELK